MVLALITLFTGLAISAVAIYYSVIGLAAIFSAAFVPIIIMGTILEVSKLVTAWWLKANWHRAPMILKSYMLVAVLVLMLITSMGIFGFLSKAHTDQNLVSGDVLSKIALYDEKIRISKENIDANRAALKQLDASVDQTLSRSTTEQGAERSVQIRRQQGPERTRLLRDIETEQKKIAQLNEERAPIAAEVRKVEAEVGPIKYIAALIYGDNPDTNLLEKAVSWVIITIVFVFDPLAVLLLLASQMSFGWIKDDKEEAKDQFQENDIKEQIIQEEEIAFKSELEMIPESVASKIEPEPVGKEFDISKHTYLLKPWISKVPGIDPVGPMVYTPETKKLEDDDIEILNDVNNSEKEAMHRWKAENPNGSLKNQRSLLAAGKINELPWLKYLEPQADFEESLHEEIKKKELISWMEKEGKQQVKKTKEI